MWSDPPPASVIPVTVSVRPETASVPASLLELLVVGAVQPDGTVTVTVPFASPPASAVYVKTIVRPVAPAATEEVSGEIVPVPSAAFTVTAGEPAASATVAPPVELCIAVQVWAPVAAGAVAPGPPVLSPYLMWTVAPPARVSPVTVIVRPATPIVPASLETAPGAEAVV